jgi:adenosylcobinamide-phosphate synthase
MKELILFHTISLVAGILLDQLIGDPHFMPHPIRAIGRIISFLEKSFLGDLDADEARDYRREKKRGALLWFIVMTVVIAVTLVVIILAYRIMVIVGIIVESILTCYILAARSLSRESMKVCKDIERGDISAARTSLSMIVGRDTECLDEDEIVKAAVETVAENTSDGVTGPIFYTAIGGPVLGMAYKAVNTMDSMLGYRNERYEHFGCFSAKADDFFGFIPSRFSAVLMIAAAYMLGVFSKDYSGKRALKIWKRDRLNHSSPNSAQTESVCAGALGLKLGGTHLYRGVKVEKPTIGDEIRRAETRDIKRAGRLMFMTEALMAIIAVVALALAAGLATV